MDLDQQTVTIGELTRIEAQPGDVFVLTPSREMNQPEARAVEERLTARLGHPVVVAPSGSDLTCLRQSQVNDADTVRRAVREALAGDVTLGP